MQTISREIVFVDAGVQNYQELIAGLPESAEVFVLSQEADGVKQMLEILAANAGDQLYSAIHLISHGSEAQLSIGNGTLDAGNLDSYRVDLQQIGSYLDDEGDILLYGCNVAQGEAGKAFVDALAEITGADVGASEDFSGSATNLNLEWQSGVIDSHTHLFDSSFYIQSLATKSNTDTLGTVDHTDANTGSYVYWYLNGPTVSASEGTIYQVKVDWSIDSNYLSDLTMVLQTPQGSVNLGTPSLTGDDYLDGYSQTSDGSKTVSWSYGSPSNGTWAFGIKDTYNDSVSSGWDLHRIDSVTITVYYDPPKPDLTVTSASLADSSVVQGSNIDLTYVVNNLGGGASSSGQAYVYLDGVYNDYDLVGGLSAGGTSTETNSISTSGLSVGTHYLTIVADATGTSTESNESNNWYYQDSSGTANKIYFTVEAPPKPDLTIYSATLAGNSVVQGTNIDLTYIVKNIGNASSNSGQAYVYLDGSYEDYDLVGGLSAGDTSTETNSISTSGLSVGSHYLTIVSDATGTSTESNESNNWYYQDSSSTANKIYFTVEAQNPDLVIYRPSLSLSSVNYGDNLNVSWEILNQGNYSAGGSKDFIYIDGVKVSEYSTGSLGAGADSLQSSYTINTNGMTSGQHSVTIAADGYDTVEELSLEGNNSWQATFTVKPIVLNATWENVGGTYDHGGSVKMVAELSGSAVPSDVVFKVYEADLLVDNLVSPNLTASTVYQSGGKWYAEANWTATYVDQSSDPLDGEPEYVFDVSINGTSASESDYVFVNPPKDAYENDGTFATAQNLGTLTEATVNQTHSINVASDVDYFKFTLAYKSEVDITTNSINGSVGHSQIALYNSSQSQITPSGQGDQEAGAALSSSITTTLDPGTYYIKAQEHGQDQNIKDYTFDIATTSIEPTISVSDAVADEGGKVVFQVNLSHAYSNDIHINYDTAGLGYPGAGNANEGQDYNGYNTDQTMTIAAGQTQGTIEIQTNADTDYEGDETFTLYLKNPSYGSISDDKGVGTIRNVLFTPDAPTNLHFHTDIILGSDDKFFSDNIDGTEVTLGTDQDNITSDNFTIEFDESVGATGFEWQLNGTSGTWTSTYTVGLDDPLDVNFNTDSLGIREGQNTLYIRPVGEPTGNYGQPASFTFTYDNTIGTPANLHVQNAVNGVAASYPLLAWDAMPGADAYVVRWGQHLELGWDYAVINDPAQTQFQIPLNKPLINGESYVWEVRAIDSAGNDTGYVRSEVFQYVNKAPAVVSHDPVADETGVAIDANITLTFDEDIQKGTGQILIERDWVGPFNPNYEVIDVTSSRVSIIDGNKVVIDTAKDFDFNDGYIVTIDEGAFSDLEGAANQKISWDFASIDTPPASSVNAGSHNVVTGTGVALTNLLEGSDLSVPGVQASDTMYLVRDMTPGNGVLEYQGVNMDYLFDGVEDYYGWNLVDDLSLVRYHAGDQAGMTDLIEVQAIQAPNLMDSWVDYAAALLVPGAYAAYDLAQWATLPRGEGYFLEVTSAAQGQGPSIESTLTVDINNQKYTIPILSELSYEGVTSENKMTILDQGFYILNEAGEYCRPDDATVAKLIGVSEAANLFNYDLDISSDSDGLFAGIQDWVSATGDIQNALDKQYWSDAIIMASMTAVGTAIAVAGTVATAGALAPLAAAAVVGGIAQIGEEIIEFDSKEINQSYITSGYYSLVSSEVFYKYANSIYLENFDSAKNEVTYEAVSDYFKLYYLAELYKEISVNYIEAAANYLGVNIGQIIDFSLDTAAPIAGAFSALGPIGAELSVLSLVDTYRTWGNNQNSINAKQDQLAANLSEGAAAISTPFEGATADFYYSWSAGSFTLKGDDTKDDKMRSGSENGIILGLGGNDTLIASDPDSSHFEGGEGVDLYKFDSGWGNDTIKDSGGTVQIPDIADISSLSFGRSGNDLVISHGNTESITIQDFFTGAANDQYQTGWTIETGGGNSYTSDALVAQIPGNAPNLTASSLTVNEGESVVVTADMLGASDTDTPADQLILTVREVMHGEFALNGTPVTQFNLADIQAGKVTFTHDGSELSGSFKVVLTDGFYTLPEVTGQVAVNLVNDAPVIDQNLWAIQEGATTLVTSAMLGIVDPDNTPAELIITISDIAGGQFLKDGQVASQFTLSDINAARVSFAHDGSETGPAFNITASDGQLATNLIAANVVFTNLNDAPVATGGVQSLTTPLNTLVAGIDLSAHFSDAESAALDYSLLSGALPDGLILDPVSGLLSGTSTAAGSFSFTVQVVDDQGAAAQKSFSMVVQPPPTIDKPLFLNGTAEADHFTLGSNLKTSASGGWGDDRYLITSDQSGAVTINDPFGNNQISLDKGVIVTDAAFSFGNLTLTLAGGATVEVPTANDYTFNLGSQAGLTLAEALQLLQGGYEVADYATVSNVPALTKELQINANGNDGADRFVFGSDLKTLADGALGDDIYVIHRSQTGDLSINDTAGQNLVQFDDGVSFDSFVNNTGLFTLTLDNGAQVTIDYASNNLYQVGNSAIMNATDFAAYASGNSIEAPVYQLVPGSDAVDVLTGTAADENIQGYAQNDILDGGAGDDLIDGGAHDDTLTGGDGQDLFAYRFNSTGNGVDPHWNGIDGLDAITDFSLLEGDKLLFNDLSAGTENIDTLAEFKAGFGIAFDAKVADGGMGIQIDFANTDLGSGNISGQHGLHLSLEAAVDATLYDSQWGIFNDADAFVQAIGGDASLIFG